MKAKANPLVLYHGSCADGFASAWVAHKALPDAEFRPVHGGQSPCFFGGREVFILGFSYKQPVMNSLVGKGNGKARTLVLIDHHKATAEELAEFYPAPSATFATITRNQGDAYCIFGVDRSSSRLTWDFFFPNQPRPWLVDYTEDGDLWKWKLPQSKEVAAAVARYPRSFDAWNQLAALFPSLAAEGADILREQQAQNMQEESHAL